MSSSPASPDAELERENAHELANVRHIDVTGWGYTQLFQSLKRHLALDSDWEPDCDSEFDPDSDSELDPDSDGSKESSQGSRLGDSSQAVCLTEFPQTLCLTGLDAARFEKLYEDLQPELERARTSIDYDGDAGTWLIPCTTGPHVSGASGWFKMTEILQTMNIPESDQHDMIWFSGQPDTWLCSASGASSSCRTPDASLCFSWLNSEAPSMALATELSESMQKLRLDSRRFLAGGCEPETDSGVQCVILLRIHPIAREMVRGENVDLTSRDVDTTDNNAMTIEIWRNARDETNGLKLIISGSNKPDSEGTGSSQQHTNPILISRQVFTLSQLKYEFIPELQRKYLQPEGIMEPALAAAKLCKAKPPIPRNIPLNAASPEGNDPTPADINPATAPRHALDESIPYFTIYFEDLVTQSEVPDQLRNLNYINVPYRVFMDAYLEDHRYVLLPAGFKRTINWTGFKLQREPKSDEQAKGHDAHTGSKRQREETADEQAEEHDAHTGFKRQREETPDEQSKPAETTLTGQVRETKLIKREDLADDEGTQT